MIRKSRSPRDLPDDHSFDHSLFIQVENKRKKKSVSDVDSFLSREPPQPFQNKKKILCNNILKDKHCTYGSKCLYAHSIADQCVEEIRKRAYGIIRDEFDLSYLDLNTDENVELLKTLTLFTKYCPDCIDGKCPGGANCKYGVYDKTLQVCYDDMYYGNCKKEKCSHVHLTRRDFKPVNGYFKRRTHKSNDLTGSPKLPNLAGPVKETGTHSSAFNSSDKEKDKEKDKKEKTKKKIIRISSRFYESIDPIEKTLNYGFENLDLEDVDIPELPEAQIIDDEYFKNPAWISRSSDDSATSLSGFECGEGETGHESNESSDLCNSSIFD